MDKSTALTFKKWLDLEQLKKQISDATESGEFPDRVFAYLSVAFDSLIRPKDSWDKTILLFTKALNELQPDRKLPMLQPHTSNEKPVAWDYPNRSWAFWSHILAKAYGWTLEYIGELDVNEALAMVQEVLTDDQLDREFVYSLSEIAYPYNKSTKKNHFKPMPRPHWMKAMIPPIRKVKFRRDMLPVGLIQDVSGMPDEFNPLRDDVQKKTKETKPPPSP